MVLVDRRSDRRNCCWVAVDDVLGGRLAASHLLEQGHRRIAYVGGPMSIEQVADRYAGSSAAVADANAKGARASITPFELPSLSVGSGRRAGQQLADLSAGQRPTAVFCANDLLALGVLQETVRQGLRIPEDLAIVGYDDIEFAGAAAIPLSSVRQPREQLGRAAAELLFEEINDGDRHRHRHVVFEPELISRESSARPTA